MKTLLFYFSDIHLTGDKPENEGAVIKAFCEDLKKQLISLPHTEAFVLIGGDLVQAADSIESYRNFYDKILSKIITLGIPRHNIFCVPGNHDAQRKWIIDNREMYAPIVNQHFTEERFNDLINGQQASIFTAKFGNYETFINSVFPNSRFNPIGYPIEINEEWSLYCINSALTSFAGYEWNQYPHLKDDARNLNIDTRRLNEWLQNNSKRKILMMHHPLSSLAEWADNELTKLIRTEFDLVLTGHVHQQNVLCNQIKGESYVWCQSPQLFTDKNDKLGYCIIELEKEHINRVIYREWFESQRCFKKGLDFADGDDGIVEIENERRSVQDPLRQMFEERFMDTMAIYGDRYLVWIDRFFSFNRFDKSFTFSKKNLYTEDDIIDAGKSLKVVTPAQYGLTSFAWHFVLKLWKERKLFGLYLDSRIIKAEKIDKGIERQLDVYGVNKENVKWLVFDNWDYSDREAKQILSYVKSNYSDVPILILCPLLEKSFLEHESTSSHEYSIPLIYMAPMQTSQLRKMVSAYNKKRLIGEEDVILKRLNDDIQTFNMHRTPLNCISLLEVFSNSFDENPVNRTAMIEKLLRIIFENEEVPSFKSLPDVKDCEFAIGYYCEQMIRNGGFYFSSKKFYSTISDFCKSQKITLDINYLFDILLKNQILCQYDDDTYGFRFAFWVYYFAAMRMTKSNDFAQYILNDENYVRYPEILKFYTGSDRTRNDAVEVITKDIEKVSDSVHSKVGIPDQMNPFQMLKLQVSDEQATKAIEKLDDDLKKSKLPTNIKDALDDKEYNPSMPYHQEVKKVWENYSVNYLQEFIAIASKALRNSDYIDANNKEKLLDAICDAWLNIIRVVYLMAPALAKNGQAGYDDFRLKLDDSYDTNANISRLLVEVISNIPYNIITWFKDNIYSAKLADLFYEKINKEQNSVIKHLMICLVIFEMPNHWDDIVRKYLAETHKSSYYFGDTIDSLRIMYSKGSMSGADLAKTRNLILLAYTKLASKEGRMIPGQIRNIKLSVLPHRENNEDAL